MFTIICSFILVFLLVGVAYYNMKSTLDATSTMDSVNMVTRREESNAQSTQAKKAPEAIKASGDTKPNESIESTEAINTNERKASEASEASETSEICNAREGTSERSFPVQKGSSEAAKNDRIENRIAVRELFDWSSNDAPMLERAVTKTQSHVNDSTGVIEGKTSEFSNSVVASWSQSADIEFSSPDCVTKHPMDAWGTELYGIAGPSVDDEAPQTDVMQKTQRYQHLIRDVMTTTQYRNGLRTTDLLETTSMSIENYDPSNGI